MKDIRKVIRRIISESFKELEEVSDEVYQIIQGEDSDMRVVMTKSENLEFTDRSSNQGLGMKPQGLWYGIGSSWIDWVRSEMPEWEEEHVFKIDVDLSKMVTIRNHEDLLEFDKKFGIDIMGGAYRNIDWAAVAKKYSGIEIAPYIYSARMEVSWYYTWDVESGCIWKKDAIKSIKRLS